MITKKFLALTLGVCLAASSMLTGCGGGSDKKPATQSTQSAGGEKSSSDKKITISYATVLPMDHAYVKSAERMNKKMMEKSGGKLGLQVFRWSAGI